MHCDRGNLTVEVRNGSISDDRSTFANFWKPAGSRHGGVEWVLTLDLAELAQRGADRVELG